MIVIGVSIFWRPMQQKGMDHLFAIILGFDNVSGF